MTLRNKFIQIICLLLVVFVAGCASIGPRVLPKNREGFNTALLRSEEQQLLLNIVRMQYSDRPYFLGIDTITSSNTLSMSAAPAVRLTKLRDTGDPNPGGTVTNFFGLDGNVFFSDSPTIIYRPLQGELFTRQMLSPISMQNIALLIDGGWGVARVLRITTRSIGDLDNARGAAQPSLRHTPDYQRFITFAHYLKQLQVDGIVQIHGDVVGKVVVLTVESKEKYKNSREVKEMLRQLGLKSWNGKINFTMQAIPKSKDTIVIPMITRSYLGMLYYLSKSVQVKPDEVKDGIVQFPVYPDGKLFDWRKVTKGMMTVHSAGVLPSNANVSVYYRNRWFYIADDDIDSKETFALMQQLFSLQASQLSGPQPILTLPVVR